MEDSNIAGMGGEEDTAARLSAAQGEDAWTDCGQDEGLEMWRIEKFKVRMKIISDLREHLAVPDDLASGRSAAGGWEQSIVLVLVAISVVLIASLVG